jgi:hypothetical protein
MSDLLKVPELKQLDFKNPDDVMAVLQQPGSSELFVEAVKAGLKIPEIEAKWPT